ncbi:hypothetical protein GN956_G1760 [Arapaima gigas]
MVVPTDDYFGCRTPEQNTFPETPQPSSKNAARLTPTLGWQRRVRQITDRLQKEQQENSGDLEFAARIEGHFQVSVDCRKSPSSISTHSNSFCIRNTCGR